MKANNIEELVTNSNIAGELRNYTDWHDRLVRFAQLVADWQKEALLEWATTNRDKLSVLSDNDAVRWGQRNAFQQMIDKLNSM